VLVVLVEVNPKRQCRRKRRCKVLDLWVLVRTVRLFAKVVLSGGRYSEPHWVWEVRRDDLVVVVAAVWIALVSRRREVHAKSGPAWRREAPRDHSPDQPDQRRHR
jgi:hypothetical protein